MQLVTHPHRPGSRKALAFHAAACFAIGLLGATGAHAQGMGTKGSGPIILGPVPPCGFAVGAAGAGANPSQQHSTAKLLTPVGPSTRGAEFAYIVSDAYVSWAQPPVGPRDSGLINYCVKLGVKNSSSKPITSDLSIGLRDVRRNWDPTELPSAPLAGPLTATHIPAPARTVAIATPIAPGQTQWAAAPICEQNLDWRKRPELHARVSINGVVESQSMGCAITNWRIVGKRAIDTPRNMWATPKQPVPQ